MGTEIPTGNRSGDIKETLDAAGNGMRSAFEKGTEKASHLKDAAFERASSLKDAAIGRGRSTFAMIERAVDERPWAVLGGVFVGGIILGMFLRRR